MDADAVSLRYARQLSIPEIGPEGQRKLAESSVVVVGAGGLGVPLLFALAGAGVGRLDIVDGDTVSETNLNRQFLYTPEDIGVSKALLAARRLSRFNPEVTIRGHFRRMEAENGAELIRTADLAVAAVDNIPARLDINRTCAALGVPLINGGVEGLTGMVMAVEYGKTPCLECFYGSGPQPEPGVPVLGSISAAVGTLMAQAALLTLLGRNPIPGELLLLDGRSMTLEHIPVCQNRHCPVCGIYQS